MAFELIKVSELPELTSPSDPNVLPIQDGDYLKRISFENLKEAVVGDVADDLAAAYDSTATYAVGDYCIYEGQLYRCTTAITTAEAWTSGHWTSVVLTDDMASAIAAEALTRSTNDNALAADIAEALGDLAAVYSTSATYAVGDYCIYQGQLYRCTTAITTAEAWTSGHWSAVALGNDTRDLRSAFNDLVADKSGLIEPTNWFNASAITYGEIEADGTILESSTRIYTDFIPVTDGDKIKVFRGDNMNAVYRRHITFYDSNKNVISGGSDAASTGAYTVPSSAAYTRVTIDDPGTNKRVITRDGVAPASYTAYFNPYEVWTEDFLTPTSQAAVDKVKNNLLTTADLKNKYGCSFPRTKFRQTLGLPQSWYYKSAVTPPNPYISIGIGGQYGDKYNDRIAFPNDTAVSAVNGYNFTIFDMLLNVIFKESGAAGLGLGRSIIAENLSSCSLLALGASTIDQDVMTQDLLDHFTAQGATLTLLGTLGEGDNKNEGRAGWSAADYYTDKQYQGVTNPFYNPSTQTFDFSYYMTNQGYSAPDFVVIQLGINDLYNSYNTEGIIQTTWNYIKGMIDSIQAYNSSIKTILILPITPNSDQSQHSNTEFLYRNIVIRYDEYAQAQALSTFGESKVRCSYCHLILDPDTDIRDNVHPTNLGYEKTALEIINQINHWQNGD